MGIERGFELDFTDRNAAADADREAIYKGGRLFGRRTLAWKKIIGDGGFSTFWAVS
jgi:hypothetical protein